MMSEYPAVHGRSGGSIDWVGIGTAQRTVIEVWRIQIWLLVKNLKLYTTMVNQMVIRSIRRHLSTMTTYVIPRPLLSEAKN